MPLTGRFQGGTEATCLSGVYGPRSRSLKAAVVPKEDTREGGAMSAALWKWHSLSLFSVLSNNGLKVKATVGKYAIY